MHREIKVGLFFLVVIAMVFGGIQFLKGRGVLHIDQEFVVYYDNVRGLAPSDDVIINGLVVGKVSSLKLDKNNGESVVKVVFTLDNSTSKLLAGIELKYSALNVEDIVAAFGYESFDL